MPSTCLAVHDGGAGPALGGPEHDHRPAGALGRPAVPSGGGLDGGDLVERRVEGVRERPVDALGVVALDHVDRVAVALEQRGQLGLRDAGQHRGVGDLVAVEVEDRQHGAVDRRVEELVGVPAGGQGAGLGLAVAHHAHGHEVGVVERGAVGVGQGVAQLAALVDRPGRLGGGVAGHATGERELAEQGPHAGLVLGDRRVQLAVAALEVGVGDHGGSPVARAAHEDHGEVAGADHPVEVGVGEVEPGGRAPVAQQAGLDVFRPQRLA